ncbi:MAG: TerD family protein [Salinarimonas sp.]
MAISLSKGQTISLAKESAGLSKVRMGLGWDPVKKKGGFLAGLLGGGGGDIDLDASCLMFDAGKQLVDICWFRQLKSNDGAVVHSGDNLTGEGDGDDESITVELERLPAAVQTLVFTVNSFRGQSFNEVENAFCRIVDERAGKEIARYTLTEQGAHTGVVMAVVSRATGEWTMKAIGTPANGRTAQDLAGAASAHI